MTDRFVPVRESRVRVERTGDEAPGPVFIAAWGTIGRIGGVGRSRAYDRSRVGHLRVSPESLPVSDFRHGLRMYGIGGGTIAFDYGARTVRVGRTDEAEARRVVEALANEGVGR